MAVLVFLILVPSPSRNHIEYVIVELPLTLRFTFLYVIT